MYHNSLIAVLLLIAVTATTGRYIASIVADGPSGQVFVLEYGPNPLLFEMDTVSLEQNNLPHFISGEQDGSTPVTNSFYIKKKGNRRFLYAAFNGGQSGSDNLKSFKLPLGDQPVLPFIDSVDVLAGSSLEPSYDAASPNAVFSPSRNLSLVNLNSLNVSDSFKYVIQSRIFGRNVVINNQNKHVIVFYSRVSINGPYGLSVDEFDINTGRFVSTETKYDCLCNGDADYTQSPFFEVVFDEQSCQMYYPTNTIWCSNSEKQQLFSFTANDLSKYKVLSVGSTFSSVVWDFAKDSAYGLEQTGPNTFAVRKINLKNGQVVASQTHTIAAGNIDVSVAALCVNEPHIYVAIFNEGDIQGDNTSATRIVTINTNTLASTVTTFDASYQ